MQQPNASAPSSAQPSFASLLAALAAPRQKPDLPGGESMPQGRKTGVPGDGSSPQGRKAASAWNDDGLADDVATLSYESALKAHARYHSHNHPTDQSLTRPAAPEPFGFEEGLPAAPRRESEIKESSAAALSPAPHSASQEPAPGRSWTTPLERDLKDASITIRMSKAECAQLHQRAAEAGMTISAYLRSCTFEAESLRAMVKETMLQLRSAPAAPARAAAPRRSLFGWLARLFTPWRGRQRAAHA